MALLSLADLRAVEPGIDEDKAQALIEDVLSLARVRVPGITGTLTLDQSDAIKAILREQVLHRHAHGDGNIQQQSAGPFSMTVDSRSTRAPILSDFAINQLRGILGTYASTASSIDITPAEVADWPLPSAYEPGWS